MQTQNPQDVRLLWFNRRNNLTNLMLHIFLNTLPFFALIALGYGSAKTAIFSKDATVHLTKFVFYFALSAMLFKFSSNLSLREILEWDFMAAYLIGSMALYGMTALIAKLRGTSFDISVIEAQCSVIGNMGWMGLAMIPILLGEQSISYVIMVLIIDLIVFGPLIVILLVAHRQGQISLKVFQTIGMGLIKNPLVLSISTGLLWAAFEIPVPELLNRFMTILGGASTPGALFAIGASMAFAAKGQISIPLYLSANKLIMHPLLVGIASLLVFQIDPFASAVMIACAAMPVAGNVYMIATHYGLPSERISIAILISTTVSIVTISLIISLVTQFYT
ncbi:MAG: malate transporter [Gammaproteobacteria bacterium]|nr:malate transporter [Gammaproteobacteria bacterium]OUX78088.1 MAG: malate transporter [Oceanospirillales bacterium TMED59]